MENKATGSHRFFLKPRQIVLALFLILSLSLSACHPQVKVDVPASKEGVTDQGDAEQETGTQIIPRKNLGVTGEFSLRNALGKLAAGTDKGLYFVLRGKLFFWDYSLKESLELATLDTRNGKYFYKGDFRNDAQNIRNNAIDYSFIPESSLVLYHERLYYAQSTENSEGEATYQIVSLNLQGQDKKVEFDLPDRIGLFYIVRDGQGVVYHVRVDQALAKNIADSDRFFYIDKKTGTVTRIAEKLFPETRFYCTENRCYLSALDEKADLSTVMQPYRLYSWNIQTKELEDENVDTDNGFFPQGNHLVAVDSLGYMTEGRYRLRSVNKKMTGQFCLSGLLIRRIRTFRSTMVFQRSFLL